MTPRVLATGIIVVVLIACSTERIPAPGATPMDVHAGANDRLLAAAASGDPAELAAALADGADVDARDPRGRTALLVATAARQTEAVRQLLAAGADVDLQDDQLDNPFLYAGAEGIVDILRLVNDAGADPSLTNRFGGTALIPASERGHVEVVRYLLEETDVDIDHVNRLGWTALLEAIVLADGDAAHQEVVRLLIEHGADLDIADKDGVRPLAHARARGQTHIAEALAAAGAQP
jgi:ankyrin repeat protein